MSDRHLMIERALDQCASDLCMSDRHLMIDVLLIGELL